MGPAICNVLGDGGEALNSTKFTSHDVYLGLLGMLVWTGCWGYLRPVEMSAVVSSKSWWRSCPTSRDICTPDASGSSHAAVHATNHNSFSCISLRRRSILYVCPTEKIQGKCGTHNLTGKQMIFTASEIIHRSTGWPKNLAHFVVRLITSSNIDQFSEKIVTILPLKISPHLKYVAKLPCEMPVS